MKYYLTMLILFLFIIAVVNNVVSYTVKFSILNTEFVRSILEFLNSPVFFIHGIFVSVGIIIIYIGFSNKTPTIVVTGAVIALYPEILYLISKLC